MKLYLFLFLLLFSSHTFAQNLDSLFNKFIGSNQKSSSQLSNEIIEYEKCGLPLFAKIKANFNNFSKTQQAAITARITPSPMQASIVSPSGFFRIHYDESGFNKPEYDINELAIALDSAYNFEVNILGYPAPPTSASIFGEDKYDVFIKFINDYGVTFPVNSIGNQKCDTYIEIHNSFAGINTEGINAAKVTAAHEFHHAIQMGCYIWNIEDRFYYEITSTSMEDLVFDEVNDYIHYLRSYFNYPETSLRNAPNDGYGHAIWNLFLVQKYEDKGFDVIKRAWELMASPDYQPAISAIGNAVEEVLDDSFKNIYNEFAVWTFFTNRRSESGNYFKDASLYPLIKDLTKDQFNANTSYDVLVERNVSSQPASNNFMLFCDDISTNDTIYAIVTNGDYITAAENPNSSDDFSFSLFAKISVGSDEIVKDEYYGKVGSNNFNKFSRSYIYNGIEIRDRSLSKREIDYSYPQPFKLAEHDEVRIPVEVNGFGNANLYIYSSSMDLVFSSNVNIKNREHPFVQWDGKDKNGNNVATGVYIYVTDSEEKIKKGKLVVINK